MTMGADYATPGYALSDELVPRPIRPAQFITAAECPPGTQALTRPENTYRRATAVEEAFQTTRAASWETTGEEPPGT